MASFIVTNKKGDDTVPIPPSNSFPISTLAGSKCPPVVYRNVDNLAYWDRPDSGDDPTGPTIGGGKTESKDAAPDLNPLVGDVIYADAALTTLYVTSFPGLDPSTHKLDYNINKGDFITIGPGSIIINTSCK